MKQQKGFTLVEMAIVLVIIGLLLGGVLKGQELIDNSKIKSIASDTAMMQAAINGYQDRFRAIPGDDIRAVANVGATFQLRGAAVDVTAGDGNGVINPASAITDVGVLNSEGLFLVQHLLAANFVSLTAVTDTSFQSNAGYYFGVLPGIYGFGASQLAACYLNVPGKLVRAYEAAYDDGFGATGSVRTSAAGGGAIAAAAAANAVTFTTATDANIYNMCISIN